MPGTKGDRVQHRASLCSSNVLKFYLRERLFRSRPQHQQPPLIIFFFSSHP